MNKGHRFENKKKQPAPDIDTEAVSSAGINAKGRYAVSKRTVK